MYEIYNYLSTQNYSYEVIIAENGSTDSTKLVVEQLQDKYPNLKLMNIEKRGKGNAVREGMKKAIGSFRFMCDADLSMPIQELETFLPPLTSSEVVLGSRSVKGSHSYNVSFFRKLSSTIFNLTVNRLLELGVRDTQCGFKCFSESAANVIFQKSVVDGWGFDVEVLAIARRHNLTITEIPISIYHKDQSKVNVFTDSIKMLKEVLFIKTNLSRGIYD